MNGPQASWLADGRRLHLNHGPIDLIVKAFGETSEVRLAYEQAVARFQTVLTELVAELPALRRPASTQPRAFAGPVARRMEAAVSGLAEKDFITPMAAVAGSVAEEILAAMLAGRTLQKTYVNNGGDIALHLAPGETMTLAIAGTGHGLADRITIRAEDGIGGVATSGWRGRSHSLGIADAVTVLAHTAAEADAAATLIANAVDLPGHAAIERQPAQELAPDSDLGDRLVTVGVGTFNSAEVEAALARGLDVAEDFRRGGLIEAAALFLGGDSRLCGNVLPQASALHVAPLCPAGHLPRMGGDQPPSRVSLTSDIAGRAPGVKLPISPHAGEMSGRTEGGAKKRGQQTIIDRHTRQTSKAPHHA